MYFFPPTSNSKDFLLRVCFWYFFTKFWVKNGKKDHGNVIKKYWVIADMSESFSIWKMGFLLIYVEENLLRKRNWKKLENVPQSHAFSSYLSDHLWASPSYLEGTANSFLFDLKIPFFLFSIISKTWIGTKGNLLNAPISNSTIIRCKIEFPLKIL